MMEKVRQDFFLQGGLPPEIGSGTKRTWPKFALEHPCWKNNFLRRPDGLPR